MMRTASKELVVAKGIASCIMVLVCLAGCSTVHVQHSRGSCGPTERDDALTLVLDYGSGGRSLEEDARLEVVLSECLRRALKGDSQAVTLIPADEFRRVVFPDLDFTFGPPSAETLVSLLEVPHFRQKTDSLHLRYLIGVRGGTTSGYEPFFAAGGSMGGAFWIIGATHDKTTNLTAHITDMKNPSETGEVSIYAGSSGFYGVFVVLPITWPAVTESPACKRLGRELVQFISDETENPNRNGNPQ
jgi:hypothetical protein